MLRIHAKDIESEGIDSLLLIDDYDKDYVRIVNPNTDPPEIYETSNAFDRIEEDLNQYLEGKLKPIVRKQKIRKYGDSVKSVPLRTLAEPPLCSKSKLTMTVTALCLPCKILHKIPCNLAAQM